MINGNDLWDTAITNDMVPIQNKNQQYNTYPKLPNNLYDALSHSAALYPEKSALVDNDGQTYTYSRLLYLVDSFASYLYYKREIRATHHIGLLMYNSIEFCVSFLALCKLGAVTVPLPSKFKKSEIISLIKKSKLSSVICDEAFCEWFNCLVQEGFSVIKTENIENGYGFHYTLDSIPAPVKSAGGSDDTAILMFTSGTTSQSKGVCIKNYNIMHAVVSYQRILHITPEDRSIVPIPIYHITGLVALLGLFIYVGGTLYLHKFFDARRVLTCVRDNEISFIHASPTVFTLLLNEHKAFPSLPSLRAFACGSSNMPMEKIRQIHRWLPNTFFHTVYGLTETTSPATIFPGDAAVSEYIGSSGFPIPGTRFRILDDLGSELPNGTIGEISIYGTVVMDSYWNVESDHLNDEGWLLTGDLGYLNEQGYLFVVDRKKDMINRGGEKIWSFDIENEIYTIPGVLETAVVAVPDELYGEVAGAVVTVYKGSTLTPESISNILQKRIAKYKVPKYIYLIDEIPKTPNNKIDKETIRLLFQTPKEDLP